MPRVTDEHRAARREQIADAALRAFAERGFQHTSMADILEEAGLSAGGVYVHFASKREIAIAVAGRVLEMRAAEIDDFRRHQPLPRPAELVASIVDGMRGELHDSRIVVQLWAEASIDAELRRMVSTTFVARLRASLVSYLTSWAQQQRALDERQAQAWALRVVPALIGLIQGYIIQSALLDDFEGDQYLSAVDGLLGV